jgi:hypothetical protein
MQLLMRLVYGPPDFKIGLRYFCSTYFICGPYIILMKDINLILQINTIVNQDYGKPLSYVLSFCNFPVGLGTSAESRLL